MYAQKRREEVTQTSIDRFLGAAHIVLRGPVGRVLHHLYGLLPDTPQLHLQG